MKIYHVGTRFKSLTDGKKWQIVGAAKGSPDGFCCLSSLKYGWSYTGKMHKVKDCHNIEVNELLEMMGGHMDKFLIIRT
jgi:hypothetical protein